MAGQSGAAGAARADRAEPTPLVVMLSGAGRTLENLLRVIDAGQLPARVSLVIASRECRGAEIARAHGIETVIERGEIPANRVESLWRSGGVTREHGYVVLAGYLRKLDLPPGFADPHWRVVNIHPALLPAFGGHGMYGDRVHAAVLAAGERESGCSVHFVDDVYDRGPVILQCTVPVQPGDTVETLAARVFAEERRAYLEALRMLIEGRVRVEAEDGGWRVRVA